MKFQSPCLLLVAAALLPSSYSFHLPRFAVATPSRNTISTNTNAKCPGSRTNALNKRHSSSDNADLFASPKVATTRRGFGTRLFKASATGAASSASGCFSWGLGAAVATAAPGGSLAPREQWTRAEAFVTEMDENFASYAAGGGDKVREALGTVGGTTSPLFQVEKLVRKLVGEAEDPVEFGEAMEDFLYRLRQADGMAYAANFAGGSGKPKPPSEYLKLSGDEVKILRSEAKRMTAAL
mmetsp:Transcript_30769/g.61611  ORF Transcript_30769/g.61611 Transcript_30769/m.61611 type:complete len:239 (-) Transcript_30769:385-1101(-)